MDLYNECIEVTKKNRIINLFIRDMVSLCKNIYLLSKEFYILVVPEILEHIINPGLALDFIKKYVLKRNPTCEIIFTVSNYQNFYYNFFIGLRGKEIVHTDHKFYFNYKKFKNFIENYNFKVNDFYYVIYCKDLKTMKSIIYSKLFDNIFQYFMISIIVCK